MPVSLASLSSSLTSSPGIGTPFASRSARLVRRSCPGRRTASKPLPGFDAVRLPGQERRTRRADRLKNGVPMPGELVSELDKLASETGITPLRGR